MRYKYRGKRVKAHEYQHMHLQDDIEWAHGSLLVDRDNRYYIVNDHGNFRTCDEVIPETVGQFTGRTAQCTDEICEHDICDVTRFDYNGTDYHYKCVVEWCSGGLAFVNAEKEIFIPLWDVDDTDSDIEVIGTIHDNPNLLESEV